MPSSAISDCRPSKALRRTARVEPHQRVQVALHSPGGLNACEPRRATIFFSRRTPSAAEAVSARQVKILWRLGVLRDAPVDRERPGDGDIAQVRQVW